LTGLPGSASVLSIFGPTGVGKTEIAIELAQLLRSGGQDPVAVSADAIQVYEGLDALSAKPSVFDLERLEHRLISIVPIDRTFSVAEFAQLAHLEIDRLVETGRTPIVVGGTGLYLRAALTALELKPPPDVGLREEIERQLVQLGPRALHGELSERSAAAIHPNDTKRIVRAVELERMGEQPYESSAQLWSGELRRPAELFGITMDRDALSARISERARGMLDGDAPAEVERALELGASRTARKALGFRELAALARGEIEAAQARDELVRRHMAYVKRQLTWMRKLADVEVIDRTSLDAPDVARLIASRLGSALRPAPAEL
jgi:tRNA dimethylallyltransferase